MELRYLCSGIRHVEQIDDIEDVYVTAKRHRSTCKEGDLLVVKDVNLKIKFYSRKGTKVFSITKPREPEECQVALRRLKESSSL